MQAREEEHGVDVIRLCGLNDRLRDRDRLALTFGGDGLGREPGRVPVDGVFQEALDLASRREAGVLVERVLHQTVPVKRGGYASHVLTGASDRITRIALLLRDIRFRTTGTEGGNEKSQENKAAHDSDQCSHYARVGFVQFRRILRECGQT